MANSIALFKQYTTILDEKLRNVSATSVLDGAPELARFGQNANELIIQKMEVSGLGNYDRSKGYVDGDVTLTNETVKCNFDRGRMFSVDNMDNAETAGMAYGRLAGVFIEDKVVPELDAFRIATYASTPGIGSAQADLKDGAAVVKALRTASTEMDEAEVPFENRVLFITPTLYGHIMDLDLTKSKAVLDRFSVIKQVPQSRMYTAIKQLSGGSSEEEGGYTKAPEAQNLNFLIVWKPAVIQYQKHVAPKVITPEMNQNADAWKFGYRNVGIADTYENKVKGIYAHKAMA